MEPEKLLEACILAKKYFRDGFYLSEPTYKSCIKKVLVSLPYESTTCNTTFNDTEFCFSYDKRARRFFFWSYYLPTEIYLTDEQNDEILNQLEIN